MRSMVEGALPTRFVWGRPPSTARCARGPPPRTGEELFCVAII